MFLSDQIDWMSGKTLSLAWHKTGLQKKIICRLVTMSVIHSWSLWKVLLSVDSTFVTSIMMLRYLRNFSDCRSFRIQLACCPCPSEVPVLCCTCMAVGKCFSRAHIACACWPSILCSVNHCNKQHVPRECLQFCCINWGSRSKMQRGTWWFLKMCSGTKRFLLHQL